MTITLSPADRATLESWQRATTMPAGRARRGRLILLVADGVPISQVARKVGLGRRHVYKWLNRFAMKGIEGLHGLRQGRPSKARRGRPL